MMKTKYAIVFIFIVALVILEKESNITVKVSFYLWRSAPKHPVNLNGCTKEEVGVK